MLAPCRASTLISTACSWVNIGGQKATILAQVGPLYLGAVGQFCIGANTQGAQTALALLSARTRPTFHAEFVAAAKRLLSRQSFDAIADEARRVIEMAA